MYSDPRDPCLVIFRLISCLSLVLCCDIHRSTLISIMYPACMITVHDRKSRELHQHRQGDVNLVQLHQPRLRERFPRNGLHPEVCYSALLSVMVIRLARSWVMGMLVRKFCVFCCEPQKFSKMQKEFLGQLSLWLFELNSSGGFLLPF